MDGSNNRSGPTQFGLAEELRRAAELITEINDAVFRRPASRGGSVGTHFRHDLEFANCLLRGIETGEVDYTDRERSLRLENDRAYAIEQNLLAARRYEAANITPEQVVRVRSEAEPHRWHSSTIGRELDFVLSHTIHHHALIAERLSQFRISTEASFGVAPSTLEYWKTRAA